MSFDHTVRHGFLDCSLRNKIAIDGNVSLEKVKIKSSKCILVFCFFFVSATVGGIITNQVMNISIAAYKPWNQWFGLGILALIFAIYCMGV